MYESPPQDTGDRQLKRVRDICLALPESSERLSHGAPTFFVRKRVFATFASNHHGDGRVAVWLPVPGGTQELLIEADPEAYFKPPYVGVRGWVGILLNRIEDEALTFHLQEAWTLVAPKRLLASAEAIRALTTLEGYK